MKEQAVELRAFETRDSTAVHRWFTDPRATQMLMEQRESFSPVEAEKWTMRAMDQSADDRKFAICVVDCEEPVGFTALYGLFRETAPELGILIGEPTAAGVGRAAEALTITKAFEEFGAHKVYGRIPARNRAAKWVVESLGWEREAIMRSHLLRAGQQPDDCEIWGVLPEDFYAAHDPLAESSSK
jgi:RimJ/RimL family protein N-acetyltransferase